MPSENADQIQSAAESRRLSINLPATVFDELRNLSEASHRSMTELVRVAFALAKVAYDETERGNKLVVTDNRGRTLKELVIPR
jgi:hypothetical protein